VSGVTQGTFTQPMPIGEGKRIPAINKASDIQMAMIGHWKDGVMDEEYLFLGQSGIHEADWRQ